MWNQMNNENDNRQDSRVTFISLSLPSELVEELSRYPLAVVHLHVWMDLSGASPGEVSLSCLRPRAPWMAGGRVTPLPTAHSQLVSVTREIHLLPPGSHLPLWDGCSAFPGAWAVSFLDAQGLFSFWDSAERLVPDRERVLPAAVHADRALPVLHQLQPRVLLAAGARRERLLLLSLAGGLCLLLPCLPQRAHPQLPGVHRQGRARWGLDWYSVDEASLRIGRGRPGDSGAFHSGVPTR